ncbi:uncharacterized protein UTRI_02155 [Ustilago trichophora]|uniref:Retrotransposon gag domain-containing protein n=1 Tax=Ustilago trichophora TaxID=86804 RepID=A0A5C3E1U8_9BASI|nr:uncharacterized protein UTRI_02155 [Ustilago trichophora]
MAREPYDTRSSRKRKAFQAHNGLISPASTAGLPVPPPEQGSSRRTAAVEKACQTDNATSNEDAENMSLHDKVLGLERKVKALIYHENLKDKYSEHIDMIIQVLKNNYKNQKDLEARMDALQAGVSKPMSSEHSAQLHPQASIPALGANHSASPADQPSPLMVVKLSAIWLCQSIEDLITSDVRQSNWPQRILKKLAERTECSYNDFRKEYPFRLSPWPTFCSNFRKHFVEPCSAELVTALLTKIRLNDGDLENFIEMFRMLMYSAPVDETSDESFRTKFLSKLPREMFADFITEELARPTGNMEELFRKARLHRSVVLQRERHVAIDNSRSPYDA